MTIYTNEFFKVFKMKINGMTYYFVARNVENSGFMFTYTDRMPAIEQCKILQYSVENGTLIL